MRGISDVNIWNKVRCPSLCPFYQLPISFFCLVSNLLQNTTVKMLLEYYTNNCIQVACFSSCTFLNHLSCILFILKKNNASNTIIPQIWATQECYNVFSSCWHVKTNCFASSKPIGGEKPFILKVTQVNMSLCKEGTAD